MKKFTKFVAGAVLLSSSVVAFAQDFLTYDNGNKKINLTQVTYVEKADSQDGAIFHLRNGATTAKIDGVYQKVISNPLFVNDGTYYNGVNNKARAVSIKNIITADLITASAVRYTLTDGSVVVLDLGAPQFLNSYYNNLQ